jgi:hypothetical protein
MAVLLAGCGSAAQTAKNPEPADSSPPVHLHSVSVGQVVALTGAARLRLAVKVRRVLTHAVGQNHFDTPRKGERFLAVALVLKNIGPTVFQDSPTYGAQVVDDTGRAYDPTVADITAGPGFPSAVRLRHGQVRAGFVVFAVPKAAIVTAVRYSLSSGSAEDRAEWHLS